MINQQRLVKLAQKLIRINSENPPGNEQEIAIFVRDYLAGFDVKCRFYEFAKNRTNLIAEFGDLKAAGSLLLSPHLDTVPAGRNWKFLPFSGKIYQGRMYGRGATDCKVNLAACIEALNSLAEGKVKLGYKIIFAATADEETGSSLGLIPLLRKRILRPSEAVILDSDEFHVIVAQKGLIHFKVCVSGKKAHGAYPWLGENAIEISSRIIDRLKKYKFSGSRDRHSLLRPATINIGTIRGGDKVNIVADWCEFEADLRFLPGMKAERLLAKVKDIIKAETHKFQIKIDGIQEPYEIDKGHKLVTRLLAAMRSVNKGARLRGSEGATVITFFQDFHIPAVATGFGVEAAGHISDEYLKIDSLYKGAKALEGFLRRWKS